jgi:hypothetical protein
MNVLLIGDIVGKPGRRAVAALLPSLREELVLDLVIANGENAAAGRGLTEGTARANYPPAAPGRGVLTQKGVTVINLQGRTFMPDIDCPFRAADALLAGLPDDAICVVDFHAEATAEKEAMGRYLDGRVAAVLGTHTHVPTADPVIFPGGTAYITDAGKVGTAHSVIGFQIEAALKRLLTGLPVGLPVADDTPEVQFNSVLVEIDEGTRRARGIERIDRTYRKDG